MNWPAKIKLRADQLKVISEQDILVYIYGAFWILETIIPNNFTALFNKKGPYVCIIDISKALYKAFA